MDFDVIVIGAGAAGMMCAAQAGQRGRRVLLIDHAHKIGERIRISGGGRCNFTNRVVKPENFISQNPHFTRSALAQFSAADFIELVQRYGIAYHEKTLGQLFCDDSATQIIELLKAECTQGDVQWANPCEVYGAEKTQDGFQIETAQGIFRSHSLVIATGGLAIPQLGASPLGYRIAEQFGLNIIPPQPALVPLAALPEMLESFGQLAGNSLMVSAQCGANNPHFRVNLLFTHRGLSGPAMLQVSSYWQNQSYSDPKKHSRKQPITVNLLPDIDISNWLQSHRQSKLNLAQLLANEWPKRIAQDWCRLQGWSKPLAEHSNKDIAAMQHALYAWEIMPAGTLGYTKAEVTLGGVDTETLSSKTMESKTVPGLFFIGEVVDVTGWLGGYNFQWAWSSGWVAGQFV
ncbi:MAG: BaiN/RdsA family NAD(P)/FAD-dependent oxidoreductase [Halothiobacillus sp.]